MSESSIPDPPTPASEPAQARGPRMSRRGFLAALGVAGVAGAGVAGGGIALGAGLSDDSGKSGATSAAISPYGSHQSGISTDQQDRLVFAAFDVTSTSRDDLQALLKTWSAAIPRLMAGEQVAAGVEANQQLPPEDTGEAVGLTPANLTVTIGFGPSLFDARFGLADKRPAALADIPALPRDDLDPTISGGDLCIQACADDPQVAFHAVRNLRRLVVGTAVLRWTQLGFGKTSSTSEKQVTPRNLMGFKDGTDNIKSEQPAVLDHYVWVGEETDQAWMKGGSYLVSRRIRMQLEAWDRDFLADQENVFGRVKDTGAPLSRANEFDDVPLDLKHGDGTPVIPANAHIRLASPDTNDGIRILRRGYNFTDGVDPETGDLDAGLFFIAFQQDPRTQFVPLQRRLGTSDALNEYISHTSSAVFACPPGFSAGGVIGGALFA
jgi:deferrochelatase/peroxidase EfeB